jgi:DNA-binding PucR family transcriptional regulator
MLAGNASATAEVLFLHRSGLLYRLRRIEALLGFGLDVFEHRAAVEVAIIALERTSDR